MIKTLKIFDILLFSLLFIQISDLNNTISSFYNTKGILSGLILLFTIVLFLKSIQLDVQITRLTKFYIFFYVFYLLYGTILFYYLGNTGANPYERIRSLTPSMLLLYVYSKWFLYYFKNNNFEFVISVISFALVINSLAILYSYFGGSIFLEETGEDRSSGLIASANNAGTTAVFTQIFSLFLALRNNLKTTKRIIFVCFYFIAVFAAFVSFSKAAMLNSLIILFLFLYLFLIEVRRKYQPYILKNHSKKVIFSMILMTVLLFSVYGNKFISQLSAQQFSRITMFTQLMRGEINDNTTTNRSSLAIRAIQLIKEDYFIGRGLNTFYRMEGVGIGPHNQYLLFLGEIGILGLIIFLIYLFIIFKNILSIQILSIRFLYLGIFILLNSTAFISHGLLYVKICVIMFALLNTTTFIEYNSRNYAL